MAPVDVTHETVVTRGDLAYELVIRQFLQPVQRQDDIHIHVRVAVVVVIMSDAETVTWGVPGNDAVARIALFVRHIKWLVTAPVYTGGGDEGNGAG